MKWYEKVLLIIMGVTMLAIVYISYKIGMVR